MSESPAVTSRYVDGTYHGQNPGWHEAEAPWKAQQVLRMLDRSGLVPRSICDVGCGSGGVLDELRRCLPGDTELVGYEPAPEPAARGAGREGIRVVHGDASQVVGPFDLVLALDVFEHVEDYLGFLRRLATRGRQFIFHVPLDLSVQSVLRVAPLLHAREVVGHLHYFCRETALATLRDAGYTIQDVYYTSAGIDAPGLGRRQRLSAIPRRQMFRFAPDLAVRLLGGYSLLVLATSSAQDGPNA